MDEKNKTIGSSEGKKKGQSYTYSDQELIRELVKSRMAQGQELIYEDLTDYELPPRTQFSLLTKPTVSIRYGEMTFNMTCIRLFEEAYYILTPVNRKKKRLMVVPCKEEESASLQWARNRKKDGVKVNRTITSEEFTLKIFRLMGWKMSCRYQVMGQLALAMPGPMPVLVFDLTDATMFDSKPVEFVNEETGEVKKKVVKYYPEEYKDCIGKSYADYIETKQMNIFEFLDEYTGQSYSDFVEEEKPENPEDNDPSENESGAATTNDQLTENVEDTADEQGGEENSNVSDKPPDLGL